MKVILEFTLPDENFDYNHAINGEKYLLAIQCFDNYIRAELKYNDELTEQEAKILDKLRNKLYEHFNDYGVTIHD